MGRATAPDLDAFPGWLRPEHEWHRWDGPYYPVPVANQADALVAALARSGGLDLPDGGVLRDEWRVPGRRQPFRGSLS